MRIIFIKKWLFYRDEEVARDFLHTNKLGSVFGITAHLVIPPPTIHQNLFISEQGGRTKGFHK